MTPDPERVSDETLRWMADLNAGEWRWVVTELLAARRELPALREVAGAARERHDGLFPSDCNLCKALARLDAARAETNRKAASGTVQVAGSRRSDEERAAETVTSRPQRADVGPALKAQPSADSVKESPEAATSPPAAGVTAEPPDAVSAASYVHVLPFVPEPRFANYGVTVEFLRQTHDPNSPMAAEKWVGVSLLQHEVNQAEAAAHERGRRAAERLAEEDWRAKLRAAESALAQARREQPAASEAVYEAGYAKAYHDLATFANDLSGGENDGAFMALLEAFLDARDARGGGR